MQLIDAHVGRPLHRGALSLFPVWNGHAVPSRGYVLAAGTVQVAERSGSPTVEQLVVTNPSDRPALVLDGDLLEGGQQHRVARRSVLVPAQRSDVLDVLCVEAGRWHGGSSHRATRRRAPVEVRAALDHGQHEVWQRIDGIGGRYGRGATNSLLHAADRADARAADLVAGLRPLPGQCGLLVGLSGQPLLLELADSPHTFAALWEPLLRSVALDGLDAQPVPTPGRRARRFVDRLQSTPVRASGAAGAGTGIESTSPFGRMRGIVWQDRLVHATALNVRHALVGA